MKICTHACTHTPTHEHTHKRRQGTHDSGAALCREKKRSEVQCSTVCQQQKGRGHSFMMNNYSTDIVQAASLKKTEVKKPKDVRVHICESGCMSMCVMV